MDPPPPPPHSHSSSSSTSFPILAISILGILATAILLLSYYLFIIKCCLNWRLRRSPLLPFRSPSLRRAHRHRPSIDPVRPDRAPRGLDDSAIRSIPTLRYARTNTTAKPPVECAVCLAELEDRELLRLLPACGHSFHIDCIDTWLQSSANCPLCRFHVSRVPIHNYLPLPVASDAAVETTDIIAAAPPPTTAPKPSRKFWQAASMGDECIDIGRSGEKDESFAVQPIRRSFSMDSSNDRALFLSVQDVLQQNCRELVVLDARRGEGSRSGDVGGGGNACGRIRRSFFSFGRSSRSATAVLPVQSEFC